jgi:hypothetical protein
MTFEDGVLHGTGKANCVSQARNLAAKDKNGTSDPVSTHSMQDVSSASENGDNGSR